MTVDPYGNLSNDLLAPAQHAFAVVPSDTVPFATACKRLWVGTGGNVKLTTVGGETVTYGNAPSGCYLYVRAVQVFSTGTSASNIIGEI